MKRSSNRNLTNTITFRAQSDHVMTVREKPVPASALLPDWWKNLPNFSSASNTLELNPGPTVTVKRCLSALDGLTSGYIVTLWTDVLVSYDSINGTTITWGNKEEPFSVWAPQQVSTYELPKGYGPTVFKYHHGWDIKTPSGWSSLIIHPTAYPNLPFKVIPGVVDTDALKTGIQTPLVFQEGFSGILEKGTPIFQILPIHRSNWVSEFEVQTPREVELNIETLRTRLGGYYAKYLRTPKSYK